MFLNPLLGVPKSSLSHHPPYQTPTPSQPHSFSMSDSESDDDRRKRRGSEDSKKHRGGRKKSESDEDSNSSDESDSSRRRLYFIVGSLLEIPAYPKNYFVKERKNHPKKLPGPTPKRRNIPKGMTAVHQTRDLNPVNPKTGAGSSKFSISLLIVHVQRETTKA